MHPFRRDGQARASQAKGPQAQPVAAGGKRRGWGKKGWGKKGKEEVKEPAQGKEERERKTARTQSGRAAGLAAGLARSAKAFKIEPRQNDLSPSIRVIPGAARRRAPGGRRPAKPIKARFAAPNFLSRRGYIKIDVAAGLLAFSALSSAKPADDRSAFACVVRLRLRLAGLGLD